MIMKNFIVFLFLSITYYVSYGQSQTNIIITNPTAKTVLSGNYDPQLFKSSNPITDNDLIAKEINERISADSLKSYILQLASFGNRNSGSDTLSATRGIGAARRWVYQKFTEYSIASENRLIPSYQQFKQLFCNVSQHRNILAVLPGSDTTLKDFVLIEGHIDSRCVGLCDTVCVAEGIEDNATGTALVMELARVMSKYTFKNTLVFLITIGEEQGLFGAEAMMNYARNENIKIKAVLNNDVIGGIICGKTSSAPSCPGLDDIDSLQVRLFSNGGFNSVHKQLVRFIKLQYQQELLSQVKTPMQLTVMSAIDRTGRGGDHIPFTNVQIPSMRFTSANEHGNASNASGYTDRQHTERDILGEDTDGNGSIDSFYVDFNYLARNTTINGVAAAFAAMGPKTPSNFTLNGTIGSNQLKVDITPADNSTQFAIAVRSTTNDWDTVFYTNTLSTTIAPKDKPNYIVSVAAVDNFGIESLFSKEISFQTQLSTSINTKQNIQLLQNQPNPFDESTIITVKVDGNLKYKSACIKIIDLNGKIVQQIPIELANEMNEILYEHGYGQSGTYYYQLEVDNQVIDRKAMIFAN